VQGWGGGGRVALPTGCFAQKFSQGKQTKRRVFTQAGASRTKERRQGQGNDEVTTTEGGGPYYRWRKKKQNKMKTRHQNDGGCRGQVSGGKRTGTTTMVAGKVPDRRERKTDPPAASRSQNSSAGHSSGLGKSGEAAASMTPGEVISSD